MKGRRCGWGSSGNSQKARGKFSRSHRQRAKAPEKQRAQTASELERRAYGVGTGWARQSWVSLLSKPPLPVVKTKTGGRRKEPQRRALQHPGERTRGLDQEGGGVRISGWGCVLEPGPTGLLMDCTCGKKGESVQSRSSQVVACSTWVHRGS